METVKDLIKDRNKLNSDIQELIQKFCDRHQSVTVEGVSITTEQPLIGGCIIVSCAVHVTIN